MSLENKRILTVACTGAWPKKEMFPDVPVTPREQADEIIACHAAGASIAHIHVRDEQQNASMNINAFRETVSYIREAKCDIVINLTTSGGLGLEDEIRMLPFKELRPEIATFDAGTMNWANTCIFENNPVFLGKLAKEMPLVNVTPEIEIFDIGMIHNVLFYKKSIEKANAKAREAGEAEAHNPFVRPHFQFVLGAPGGAPADVHILLQMLDEVRRYWGDNFTWGGLGIGRGHLPIINACIALGGHIRVGMEDNVYYRRGQLAKSNVEFVERTKRMLECNDLEIATPDEARQILNLNKANFPGWKTYS
ncbi:3-keto-5-aminohexanoate cleavage protein [Vibrio sp. HA2012]|uniref:3-keto-5-aminohexanoate cleavage protein n=1 Tax=Vibrio sp. HA2012 TaxID=1971595 RepID=UPI000C2C837A|nr:3-keto-5-aminohexanoate cleavage protein [Vibrio sp. HA2012]PJC86826.1 3-keto-5-aminohexanoate cleavage protein [Vibrio sp. HA2012]